MIYGKGVMRKKMGDLKGRHAVSFIERVVRETFQESALEPFQKSFQLPGSAGCRLSKELFS